jgi:CheY-like chemotaxis protein
MSDPVDEELEALLRGGRLLRRAAHGLANELAVLRLGAEVLGMKRDLPEEVRSRLATMEATAARAGEVLHELSALGEPPSGVRRTVDLREVLTALQQLLQALCGSGVAVVLDLPDSPVPVEVDVDVLRREVVDAVVAARDEMPRQSTLRLGVADGEVVLAPSDGQAPRSVPVAVGTSRPAPAEGGVVLVVEDDPMLRELIRRALEVGGYQVRLAAHPDEALADVALADGAVDLLLTDLDLPAMDGHELARRVAEAVPGIRVLLMSGYVDPGDETVLAKPFGIDTLLERVGQAFT